MRVCRGFVLALFFLLSSSSSKIARAEGSAEFDAADVSGTHDPNDQALTQDTQLYVDISASADEQICWRGNGSLIVSRPNAGASVGTINNNQCVGAVTGVDGAYGIDMQSDQNLGTEWDIRVCPKSVNANTCFTGTANERIGRLWSYNWNFQENTNFAVDYSINGSVFAIVPGGAAGRDAVIEMQMRGVSGARYHLLANSIGPEDDTTPFARVGRSVPRTGHRVTPSFPLYLNLPAKALYNWLQPQITNVVLTPNCGGGIVQDRTPGTISFNSNVTGQYVVICDVDKNSVYDFAAQTDFSSFGAASAGANTVTWNGRNNAGTNATEGDYNCIVRLNVGEFHYMAEDIETAYPGIRMFRIENDKSTRTGIPMFWDDTLVPADAENMPNSQLSPVSPVAGGLDPGTYASTPTAFYYTGGNTSMPQGNARAWGNYDADGKGNETFLDQFASADTAISTAFVVKVIGSGTDADSDGLTNTRECDIGSNLTNNDSDGDGVLDGVEASASTAPNTDNDGPIDILDPDSDNDGVNDGADQDRLNPNVCRDTDGDNCDDCVLTGSNKSGGSPTGDGTDTDSDGKCNTGDPDDDNDGVPDAMDSAPLNPNVCRDVDNDQCDDCILTGSNQSGGSPSGDGTDTDSDGNCNTGDPDDDNDGVPDAMDSDPLDPDVCRDMDGDACDDCGLTGANGSGGDTGDDGDDADHDGLCDDGSPGGGNDGDPDDDNDGVDDGDDSAPLDPTRCRDSDADGCDDCAITGADQSGGDPRNDGPDPDGDGKCNSMSMPGDDSDGDGVPDSEDLDRDNDGIPNTAEGTGDLDRDGIPNALDLDSDGDGRWDVLEGGGGDLDQNDDGRIDTQQDSDPRDGLHDPLQRSGGALPLPDGDGDGAPDFLDAEDDSDGDGVPDSDDLDRDNDGIPNSAEGPGDLDGDGIPNALDLDSDGDGRTDIQEAGGGALDADGDGRIDDLSDSDPQDGLHDPLQRDGAALPLPDDDGDGKPEFLDPGDDADGDGVLDIDDLDRDNDGIPNSEEGDGDLDGDGIANVFDLDSDGDGVSDLVEAGGAELDSDGNGRIDPLEDLSPRDGWHDPLQRDGGALPLPDTDGDGKRDFLDVDDDGDGVSTRDERPHDESVDTDGDGDPDYLDPDDDGDGLSTSDERPDGEDVDSDEDGRPDYLDPDDDDDGVPTKDELDDDGSPRDSDKDGKPDHLDADDDGDGIPTSDERNDGEDIDTDGDHKPDHLDADDDGDGIPTEDEPEDADHDGTPDRLEPKDTGTLAGGALCSVRQPGSATHGLGLSLVLLSIAAACALRGRRRRTRHTRTRRRWLLLAAAGGVLAGQQRAHAQVALDQYRPAPLATDGFAIGRPVVLPHLGVGAVLELDYANDPLVYERVPGDPDSEEHVVETDLVLHAAFALGLWDRLALFLGVPVHLVMDGDSNLSIPAPLADGAGLGDILFGARVRIAGDDESLLAFAGELLARFPTAEAADRDQSYRGDEIGSYEPALLLELHAGIFDVRARTAVRLRDPVTIGSLELGQEFLYGLGMRLRVLRSLHLHGEFHGSTFLNDAFDREHSPAEALFGAKLDLTGWVIGAAAGPGLMRGYGSPDVRVVGMLGYAEPREVVAPPVDTDHDGLLDLQDKCPREPEDFDHFQDTDGCPDPDNDQDGVLDVTDKCRNDPEDIDSFEDADGCPDPDNDRDGILDVNDRCPLEAEDTDDFEDSDGCPDPDNDKDRILDPNDACPDQPEDFDGFEDTDGCPEPGEGLVRLTCEKIEIKDSVYFDSGKDRIQERSFTLLNQVAAVLQQATQIKRLRVEGHTDDKGKDSYNLELSQRRAAAVLRYLVERGIAEDRLASEGYGETKPITDNKTAAGRSQNRRVEFLVIESDGCP
ncbi:MAG TPA: OmpA family protein [Polyangiales bacterium]|nr:OmpA family protein [Polyangiales bacterium]